MNFIITMRVVAVRSVIQQQFWFAEAILTKRFVEATKSFSP